MVRLASLFLDCCNLQLQLSHQGNNLRLESPHVDELTDKLRVLTQSFLPSLDPTASLPQTEIHAIFDGRAFHGKFATMRSDGMQLDQRGNRMQVVFTDTTASADDLLYTKLSQCNQGLQPAVGISSAEVEEILTRPKEEACVFEATRLRSLSGAAHRSRREAFMRTCGLPRVGDVSHFPGLCEAQRARSLGLVKGVRKLPPGLVSFKHVREPVSILVSDDRGLRRRCMSLASPPLVFGRAQFYSLLVAQRTRGRCPV